MKKTNAMRILDKEKIPYETAIYDDDGEHTLERGAAEKLALELGINPKAVFKTIVMRTDSKEICVFCQDSVSEINLKKARTIAGAKEINPVKPEELLALTGYVRGGCSPIGMKRNYRTFRPNFRNSKKNRAYSNKYIEYYNTGNITKYK